MVNIYIHIWSYIYMVKSHIYIYIYIYIYMYQSVSAPSSWHRVPKTLGISEVIQEHQEQLLF